MKRLWRILLVVLALIIIAVVILMISIDAIAKFGVERGGSYALGVDTTLDSLKLGLLSGELTMNGLRVANPAGFSGQQFMKSGRFELSVRPASLLSDTIQVNKFELDGLEIDIEQRTSGSNVGTILDNLKRLGGEKKKGQENTKEQPSEGKKVMVDKVLVKNVQARFHLLPEVSPLPITVKVPEIELTNVSSEDAGGVVVAQLVARILPAILKSVLDAGEGVVPADFLKTVNTQLTQTVKAIGGQAEKLLNQAAGQLKGVGEKLKEGGTSAAGALKEILGGKKEQDKPQ